MLMAALSGIVASHPAHQSAPNQKLPIRDKSFSQIEAIQLPESASHIASARLMTRLDSERHARWRRAFANTIQTCALCRARRFDDQLKQRIGRLGRGSGR